MSFLTEENFRFESEALSADAVGVVEFKGEEGLSVSYRFEILLVSTESEIDIPSVVQMPACFTIRRNNEADTKFHGIVCEFQQLHAVGQFVFYRAILVPRLWWLSLTHHNQVFLDLSVPEMVEAVLIDAGLTANDFEFRLKEDYPKVAYACQYGETHFDFISRRLEHEGIYYFFEQNDGFEKIIFTDTEITETACSFDGCMLYATPTGLDQVQREEAIQSFTCSFGSLPSRVRLKDYNYRRPSVEISGRALVDENGRGEVYLYGEHFPSPEEGDRLANIRAQELFCRQQIFKGESTIPCLQPGYSFEMDDHYRDSFNRQYVTVKLRHEGSQSGYLVAGIADGLSDREKQLYYRNQFSAIANDVQYRPLRATLRPTISGSLNGKIDGTGSGKYALLDKYGRYKVILPFDLSGRDNGRASTWLRMAQPYAGTTHGMHFPLHKDTEVLLSFIQGDPDRPVITGAVPNPETPSPVTSKDATMAKITTAGGNRIHIEDKKDSQRILLHTPSANTWFRMGTPNDPPSFLGKKDKDSLKKQIEELQERVDALEEQEKDDAKQSDLDALDGRVDDLETEEEKDAKQKDLNQLKNDLDALETRVNELEIEEDQDAKQADLEQLRSDLASLQTRVSTLETEEELDAKKADLEALRTEVVALTTRVTTLETELANHEANHPSGGLTEDEIKKFLAKDEGYTISTNGNAVFKTGGKKIELIIGQESKAVLGNVFEAIAGSEEKVSLIHAFDFVGGAEEKIVLGFKVDYEATKAHFSTSEQHIKGEITELAGATTRMVGETTKMIGENTKMIGTTTRMVGQNTKMIGETLEEIGNGNEVVGQIFQTWGDSIKVIGTGTLLQGERTVTCGNQTILAGSNTMTAGNQVNMAENHTNLGLNNTTIAGTILMV